MIPDTIVYGTQRTYEYHDPDFDKVLSSVTQKLLDLKDYYPVEASLTSVGSNRKLYVSDTMTLHRHDPRMIKNQLQAPINRSMQNDLENAAVAGDFTPINSVKSILTVTEKKKLGKKCPNCDKYFKQKLKRHLQSCGKGKWCTTCFTLPTDLASHKQQCDGELFPCRVCGTVMQTAAQRNEHEKACRRPDSNATGRSVRPRSDIAETSEEHDVSQEAAVVTENTALDGLFRTIALSPPAGTGSDYEGALINLHEQLVDIIDERRGGLLVLID